MCTCADADECLWVFRERHAIHYHLVKHIVSGSVPNQDSANQVFSILGHIDPLVDSLSRILKGYRNTTWCLCKRIAEAGNINTDELQFGRHIETAERSRHIAVELSHNNLRHFVTWRH